MQNHRNPFRNWLIFLVLLPLVLGMVAGLSYLSALLGIWPAPDDFAIAPILVSPIPSLQASPIARYIKLDPALLDALDILPSNYGERHLGIYHVQPVGIYLPRTGDTQFVVQEPTPL